MDMGHPFARRRFLRYLAGGAAALTLPAPVSAARKNDYRGPNVIIVRFGGGVRRGETIDPEHIYSPYLCLAVFQLPPDYWLAQSTTGAVAVVQVHAVIDLSDNESRSQVVS